ncbi:MAG: DEAD/DEAH box helicase, partial [Solirubrobacteraceae bacterium]
MEASTATKQTETVAKGNGAARNVGRIEEIQGVVIEAVFPDRLPAINHAITVARPAAAAEEEAEGISTGAGAEEGVLVCAPTGMGKTLIAEAAAFEALSTGSTIYYTTPLIALTDQKFQEMQGLAERWGFRREDVGLVTGNR